MARPSLRLRAVFRPARVPTARRSVEQTVTALQAALAAKPFSETPPRLSFTFGCATAEPTSRDAVKGPWGPELNVSVTALPG